MTAHDGGAMHHRAAGESRVLDLETATDADLQQLEEVREAPRHRRFRKKGRGIAFWFALFWVVLIALLALTADFLPLRNPNAQHISDRLATPFEESTAPEADEYIFLESRYILGTDGLGRDILARIVFGARVSIIISIASVTIGLVIGGTLGLISGYVRGILEGAVVQMVNIILAFPPLILLLTLAFIFGQSLLALTLVIGFFSIPIYTRVARATTLAVSQREFVLAAKAMGARTPRILFREIAPNVVLPALAFGLVAVAAIIVLEGALAFLGLSVERPAATWGTMIAEGRRHLGTTAHLAFIPSFVMFLTVLSINFIGDSLRRRFDVKEANV